MNEIKSYRVGDFVLYVRSHGLGVELRVADHRRDYLAERAPDRSIWDDLVVVNRATWDLIESLLKFRMQMDELRKRLLDDSGWPSPAGLSEVEWMKAQRDAACFKIQNAIAFLMVESRRVS